MPYRIHTTMNGSALMVIVQTAKEAMSKLVELAQHLGVARLSSVLRAGDAGLGTCRA
jgi:hypothetical protein